MLEAIPECYSCWNECFASHGMFYDLTAAKLSVLGQDLNYISVTSESDRASNDRLPLKYIAV
jgi:hypothetical protein